MNDLIIRETHCKIYNRFPLQRGRPYFAEAYFGTEKVIRASQSVHEVPTDVYWSSTLHAAHQSRVKRPQERTATNRNHSRHLTPLGPVFQEPYSVILKPLLL